MPKAFVNGININYLQAGQGPDIVMVHGLAANLAFWNLKIVSAFVSNFRVTTYDLRGHGYSDVPTNGYKSSDMVQDLGSLLDYLNVERAHLVGHSFGGGVILEYAALHPERVLSLTLADATVLTFHPLLHRARRRGSVLKKRFKQLGIVLPNEDLNDGYRLLEQLADPKWKVLRQSTNSADFFVPFGQWNGANRTAKQWLQLLRTTTALSDFRSSDGLTVDQIRKIEQPALVIFGEWSRYLPSCWELQRNLPYCRTVIVPGAGHFHPTIKPQVFALSLQTFLTSLSG